MNNGERVDRMSQHFILQAAEEETAAPFPPPSPRQQQLSIKPSVQSVNTNTETNHCKIIPKHTRPYCRHLQPNTYL